MTDHDGKWVLSACMETWNFAETYDTRRKATENVHGYAHEHGCEVVFVGQATRLTYDGLLSDGDVENLAEAMDERAGEEGGTEDSVIEMTGLQLTMLREHIAEWMLQNLDPINWYVVESVTEHSLTKRSDTGSVSTPSGDK